MSGFLRKAAMLVGAAALVATGIGAVGGLAIGVSAATGVGYLSAGLSATIGIGISGLTLVAGGLGALASLTAKKPVSSAQGTQTQFKLDPGGPIAFIMGRTSVGGTIVHRCTYGTESSYKTYFVALGIGGPYQEIEGFTADKVGVPFGAGGSVTGYYAKWMWLDRQLGATPEARALNNGVGSPPYGVASPVPNWGDAYRLSGYAASSLTLLFDTKQRRYSSGEPVPGWIVQGAKAYDPRLDSTRPGGSGPHRWAEPTDRVAHQAARATWTYTETPALLGLRWRLGIWECDEADYTAAYKRVMGIGAPIDLIDVARIAEAATVQEAAGFKIGGQVDSSQEKWTVLKLIDEAGAAEPVANGALLSIFQQMPRVPLATIKQGDLAGGQLVAPGMVSRTTKLNGYRARFRSEPHGWEMVDINIVQIPDYVAADGREHTGSGDFALVQDANQCATLAAYKIFDSRELLRELPLKPLWAGYRIGDCLSIDMPEMGLLETNVVRGRKLTPSTAIVTLSLRTESTGKHAAALGQTPLVPPTPSLSIASDQVAAPAAGDWQLSGTALNADGGSVPALHIVGAVGNPNAEAVVVEYRQVDAADWQSAGTYSPETHEVVITSVAPGTQYEVAVRYRVRGIVGDRLVLGPVTAGDLSAPILPGAPNSISLPISGSATAPVAGGGGTTWKTLWSQNAILSGPGSITAIATLSQSFPDGDKNWEARLLINGIVVCGAGGQKTADSVALSGELDLPAGTYPVELQSATDSSVSAANRFVTILRFYGA